MSGRVGPTIGAVAVLAIGAVAAFVLLTQDDGGPDDQPASTGEAVADGEGETGAVGAATAATGADPAGPSTTAATSTTFQRIDETVEEDEASPDALESVPEDGTAEDDGNGAGADPADGGAGSGDDGGGHDGGGAGDPPATVATTTPTTPAPTDGTCRVATGALDGRSGVVELGRDGACGAVQATIVGVNPRNDLTDVRWGRDIRVCQRHPAADAIRVEAVTGGGTIDLDEGLSRTDADGVSAPIEALVVTFRDESSPVTGPRPIATCRTSTAELSIIHRPSG